MKASARRGRAQFPCTFPDLPQFHEDRMPLRRDEGQGRAGFFRCRRAER